MKSTAVAPANIALIKYWGKRDERLILPQNSSLSFTLDQLFTTTTVEFDDALTADEIRYDGQVLEGEKKAKVSAHLDLIRTFAGQTLFARVDSTANFPMAAGLASSASGFAALTLAAVAAFGLDLDEKTLSILARQGSGSASRSVPKAGGLVKWERGETPDGADSFAHTLLPAEMDFGLRMLVTIGDPSAKKISSRAGMRQTVQNCPYYSGWLETVQSDLQTIEKAILERDFTRIGHVAERNALKMHALMMATTPPIVYFNATTLEIMRAVWRWREEGLEGYLTIDGGPQVKILCRDQDLETFTQKLGTLSDITRVMPCRPGPGARLIEENLF